MGQTNEKKASSINQLFKMQQHQQKSYEQFVVHNLLKMHTSTTPRHNKILLGEAWYF